MSELELRIIFKGTLSGYLKALAYLCVLYHAVMTCDDNMIICMQSGVWALLVVCATHWCSSCTRG
jgi:hypothetical protein